MKKNEGLKGIDEVLKNLSKEVDKIEKKTLAGLILCAVHVKTEMADNDPLIPINLGNLNASFFITSSKGVENSGADTGSFVGEDADMMTAEYAAVKATSQAFAKGKGIPFVVMGFSANYAIFVHENMEAVFQRPGSGPKFFQRALERSEKEIINILKETIEIKK